VGSTALWIGQSIAIAVVLVLVELLRPPRLPNPTLTLPSLATAPWSITAAISLLYVVLVPPFQAPDEPTHLLGYAYVTENRDLPAAATAWARRMHFMRLYSRVDERFLPSDTRAPELIDWKGVFAPDFARSSV